MALGREGPLTLLLVGTFYGKVYVFDCLVNNELFDKGGLRFLLENTKVLKVSYWYSIFTALYCGLKHGINNAG